jgi:fructoselysine-6-P-deglycase FrlB-like protein
MLDLSLVSPEMSEVEHELTDQPRCWRLASDVAKREWSLLPRTGDRVCAVGCGTSYFIAQAFAAAREQAGRGETDAFAASEMPLGRTYDQVVLISRSGTTSEVVDLVARLDERTRTIAITASPGTPIGEFANEAIALEFADESAIVQTRFATSVLALLRAHIGEDIDPLAQAAERALTAPLPIDGQQFRQFVFIGRGVGVGLANEAALKMRETSGAWSEAYPAMELRHGPMSTLGPTSVVWCLGRAPDGLADEVRTTGATWVASDDDPMVALTLVQRAAVINAEARGLDPDRPPFLSRSVILPGRAPS